MIRHRALNALLLALIVWLLAYFGPHLDESACLLAACGFIDLDETADAIKLWDVVAIWAVLILMAVCTLAVVCGAIGYFAHQWGWL